MCKLEKNIKKINELKKENYKLKEKNNDLVTTGHSLYRSNYDEFLKIENEIKKNKNKIELNNLKMAILKNNLHFLLRFSFECIKEEIIEHYEKRKIGEKTKEKIMNNIKKFFFDNFNVNIGGYISIETGYYNSYYDMKITLYFLNAEGHKDFTLQYNEEFTINFTTKDNKTEIYYYNTISEYIEIEDLNKKAGDLMKEYHKTKNKIEKMRLQQKEIYHNFKDYLQAFVYNELEIETTLRIY